jgi:hypothetical protein
MWLLADLDAIRRHEARDELEAILVWRTPLFKMRKLVEGSQRVLLTARSGEPSPHWAIAVDHTLGPKALEDSFVELGKGCRDHPIEGAIHSVRCGITRPFVIAAPTPTLVVVVREEHADVIPSLAGSGGLPEPKAAFETHVEAPREAFRGRQMPEVPATIEKGYGELRLLDDGSASLLLEGTSTSAHQAQQDAEEVNGLVDALDLPVPDLLMKALRRMLRFEVDGKQLRMERTISLTEVRVFMLLVDAMTEPERSRGLDSIGGP